MTIKPFKVLGALALLGFGTMANAATVSLTPSGDLLVLPGDVLTFQIDIDFTAEGGTLGGGFDLTYDASQLQLVEFQSAGLGDPAFGRDPDVTPGLLESWGVGDFAGIQAGTVGTVTFEVLAGATTSVVQLGPTMGIAGPWVSAVDFVTIIEPDYGSATVTAIPVPAAVWFMLSGLGALFGMRRQAA